MIRLSKSVVGDMEAKAVRDVIVRDGYLGMGAEVKKFEEDIALFLEVPEKHVVCVASGTAALHLSIEAILQPGDEILVQSLTYVATFQAISGAGVVPVACEVKPSDFTIDLNDAEKRLTPKTKAIMPVHYASNPGDLDGIYAFAKRHKLRVIEDAAHSFGCTYRGRKIGGRGDICCFSFDGIKNITSGEGGVIVTDDVMVLDRVKDARLLGVERDTDRRFAGERSWEFDVSRQGYRYHMSNIMAAIGRVQLKRLVNEFAPKRIELAKRYRERLSNVEGISLLQTNLGEVIPHLQPIRVRENKRDLIKSELEKRGVQTGIHYKPNHLLTIYHGGNVPLSVTEDLYKEILSLPLHPDLAFSDVDCVCDIIIEKLCGGGR